MRKSLAILAILLVLVFLIPTSIANIPTNVRAQQPGPATDTLEYKAVPADQAISAMQSGAIDLYIFGLRPSQAVSVKNNPNIKLYYAPSMIVDFGVNPAPAPKGQLNPFMDRRVRFALNYLIDRNYVVNQIYSGFASPMYTFLSQYDPDYVTIYDIIAKYEFKYDPAKADVLITAAMKDMGAEKVNGKWYYNGNPVTINFIIRIEDERREIGDALASALDKEGFTVNREYMSFGQAIPIVYGTNPADLQWSLYTEGWGKSGIDKYDFGTINQFGAPWYGWLPGYGVSTWWNYKNSTIDKLCKKIYFGNFTTKDERNQIYKKASELITLEAVRVWVSTKLTIYPASSQLTGLTEDIGAGLEGLWNPREVAKPGSNTVKFGHLHVWTEGTVWNPIGGFSDVYSVDIWRAIYDPLMWTHPFSGEPIPFRAHYTVATAGPKGTLNVPSDAFMYDNATHSWKLVGNNVKATSKVVFDLSSYIGHKWHDGTTISWADFLYGLWQTYEIAYNPHKAAIESETASTLKATLEPFVGFRIAGNNLEVYINYWHFDSNYIAYFAAPPVTHWPWEVMAASDYLVFGTEKPMYGYSDTTATNFNVPQLSLVLHDHASDVVNIGFSHLDVDKLISNVFTVNGKTYETTDDATARVKAATQWFNDHGHLVISDGPYYLDVFDPEAQYARLKAFRDPTYPFTAGTWVYGIPQTPEILSVGIQTVTQGQTGNFIVDVSGLGTLGVKYLVKNPLTGEILKIGSAKSVTSTRFAIILPSDFTTTLKPGIYELTVAVYSNEVAMVSAQKYFFTILAAPPKFNTSNIVNAINTLKGSIDSLTNEMTSLSASTTEQFKSVSSATQGLGNALKTLNTYMMVLVVLVIIDIIVSAIAVVKKH